MPKTIQTICRTSTNDPDPVSGCRYCAGLRNCPEITSTFPIFGKEKTLARRHRGKAFLRVSVPPWQKEEVIQDQFLTGKAGALVSTKCRYFFRIQSGECYGATSVLVFANVFYILRKIKGQKTTRIALQKLKSLLRVMTTSEASLETALHSTFTDFEDSIQYFTAQSSGATNLLITRNIKDYKTQNLPVMTPQQFLESLKCQEL